MTPAEKDTTILWNEKSQEVSIFTHSSSIKNYCESSGFELRKIVKDYNDKAVAYDFYVPITDFVFGKKGQKAGRKGVSKMAENNKTKYVLLPEERETIINWSEADSEVNVYTASPKVAEYCKSLGWELRETRKSEGEIIGWEYYVPVKEFFFGKRKKMNLTPEQKKQIAERLKKARKK